MEQVSIECFLLLTRKMAMLTISSLFKVALFQILVLPRFEMYTGFQTQCSLGCLSQSYILDYFSLCSLKEWSLAENWCSSFWVTCKQKSADTIFKQYTFLVGYSMQWLVMLQLLLLAPLRPGGISSQFWRRRMEKENDCFLDTWKWSWVSPKFPSTIGS